MNTKTMTTMPIAIMAVKMKAITPFASFKTNLATKKASTTTTDRTSQDNTVSIRTSLVVSFI